MRGFVFGALFGAAVGIGGLLLIGRDTPNDHAPTPVPTDMPSDPTDSVEPGPTLLVSAELVGRPAVDDPAAPFADGTALLRVGDAFTFGQDHSERLVNDADEEDTDVVCQDIRHGGSLRAPHGAARVPTPFTLAKEAIETAWVFEQLSDGPEDFPERNVYVTPSGDAHFSGVALIQARDGSLYKVRLLEVHGDPRVWMRWIRIAYERVDTKRAGGGLVFVPGQPRITPMKDSALAEVRSVLSSKRMPSDSFRNFLKGDYSLLVDLPEEMDLQKRAFIALDKPLETAITFNRRGGLVARAGIADTGHVTLKSYSGVLVEGEMEGTIDVKSYAYVHVRGDVTGTIHCNSYATVVVEGDVRGTIQVGSYVTLRVKGRFVRPECLSCKGSCWSTFFFDQYHSEGEIKSLPANTQITLHLRTSDLSVGKHKTKPWREVIVGDKVWEGME